MRRLAAGLLARGLAPGSHIGILANNSHRYWETYFAAHYAGTPLAPLNIRLSAQELEFIIRDGELRTLLVGPEYWELVSSFRNRLDGVEEIVFLGDDAPAGTLAYEAVLEAAAPLDAPARTWHENDLLNLCYTGGTTGLPKGVMLSQRNVMSNAMHVLISYPIHCDDVYLHVAPMFHLADAWACYTMTLAGCTQVFAPRFEPSRGFRKS